VRFFFGLAFSMFQSIFSLYAANKLQLSTQTTGFVLAYVGLLSVLVQGVGIGIVTKRFRENAVIITALWLMVFGLAGWALTPNLPVLLVVMLPLSLGGGTLNTVLNSALTKAVTREEIGGTLGISTSLESVTRVIAPSVGGFLLGSVGALGGLVCLPADHPGESAGDGVYKCVNSCGLVSGLLLCWLLLLAGSYSGARPLPSPCPRHLPPSSLTRWSASRLVSG
jgi:MFS family permease